jgi:hypothetical protein
MATRQAFGHHSRVKRCHWHKRGHLGANLLSMGS